MTQTAKLSDKAYCKQRFPQAVARRQKTKGKGEQYFLVYSTPLARMYSASGKTEKAAWKTLRTRLEDDKQPNLLEGRPFNLRFLNGTDTVK
jgi:hypothetical protein